MIFGKEDANGGNPSSLFTLLRGNFNKIEGNPNQDSKSERAGAGLQPGEENDLELEAGLERQARLRVGYCVQAFSSLMRTSSVPKLMVSNALGSLGPP